MVLQILRLRLGPALTPVQEAGRRQRYERVTTRNNSDKSREAGSYLMPALGSCAYVIILPLPARYAERAFANDGRQIKCLSPTALSTSTISTSTPYTARRTAAVMTSSGGPA
jgi:hypothetical protein